MAHEAFYILTPLQFHEMMDIHVCVLCVYVSIYKTIGKQESIPLRARKLNVRNQIYERRSNL